MKFAYGNDSSIIRLYGWICHFDLSIVRCYGLFIGNTFIGIARARK